MRFTVTTPSKRLSLNCNISQAFDTVSVGTTFWCRPAALKKLIEYPWSYDDFEENIKRREGDILHCLERIFEYSAQDQGFYTGVVMPISHAQLVYSIENHLLRINMHEKLLLSNKNKDLKKKIKKMKNSKSWKYTSWLRKK